MGELESTWILAALRTFAILRAQALWRTAVGVSWPFVAAGLALVLAPAVAGPSAPQLSWTTAGIELLVGTAIGIVVSLPGWALLGAATASATALRVAPKPMLALTVAFVLAVALSLGLHRPLLFALRETGQMGAWAIAGDASWIVVARSLHAMTLLALALATPVLLCLAVAHLTLSWLGRGPAGFAPVADAVTPWIGAAGALVALGASWQAYGAIWAHAALGVP